MNILLIVIGLGLTALAIISVMPLHRSAQRLPRAKMLVLVLAFIVCSMSFMITSVLSIRYVREMGSSKQDKYIYEAVPDTLYRRITK